MTSHSHISHSLNQMLSFAITRATGKVHKKWHILLSGLGEGTKQDGLSTAVQRPSR